MSNTIVTYGGGEILQSIFNALAMLLSKEGNLMTPLMIISISCGALWVTSKAFFTFQAETVLSQFFIPMLAIVTISMGPTTSVYIEDKLSLRSYKVDNVPFFLGCTTQLISSIGSRTTEAIERVMHAPNDVSYNSTGMIFGSETALDFTRYKISNATLENNLKRFSKQCVFYDLALNRYTLDQLKKSSDLWGFLEERTSKVRMIPYNDPLKAGANVEYLTCIEAIRKMSPIFDEEKAYHAAQDIGKHLPLTYQALTGLQRDAQDLIGQQLMMNVIAGELSPEKLAKSRAQAQQKSTYLALSSLASNSLVSMRAVIEAIVYAAIILVLPLSLLPGGISFLTGWLWLTIWIQAWPPFYAIINYCMQVISKTKSAAIFQGLNEAERSLSFFTNAGLINLHEDLYALSGYLAASIPFLSWAILKGGASSFIHMAGSLMTPAHSAATSAAGEQVSGNYNLANASMGQMSFANTTGFQHNLAPALTGGHFSENQGNLSTTYAGNEMLLRHPSSELRWNVSSDSSITDGYQTSMQNAMAYSDTQQKTYMESISSHGRTMSDLTGHLSHAENYSTGISQREAYDVQESARFMMNQAKSLSEQTGISERDSLSLLVSTKQATSAMGAAPGIVGIVGGLVDRFVPGINSDTGISRDEVSSSALNVTSSDEFQTHYAKLTDFATSSAHNVLNDQGVRLVEAATRSLDEVASSQEQYQHAISRSLQESETASYVEQHAYQIRSALNQNLVNWTSDRFGPEAARYILTEGTDMDREKLITDFVSDYRQSHDPHLPQGDFQDPTHFFEQRTVPTLDRDTVLQKLFENTHADLPSWEIHPQDFNENSSDLNAALHQTEAMVDHKLETSRDTITELRGALPQIREGKQDGWVQRVGSRGLGSIGKYGKDCLPLGWIKE